MSTKAAKSFIFGNNRRNNLNTAYGMDNTISPSLLAHEAIDFVKQAPEYGGDERGVGDEATDDSQHVLTNVPHLIRQPFWFEIWQEHGPGEGEEASGNDCKDEWDDEGVVRLG